jgi:hypothetical protein
MVIRFTLSAPTKVIKDFAGQITRSPPLPEHITKKGPYIKGGRGARSQVVIIYEFDKSNLARAWENISKNWDAFCGIPGFALSAHLSEEEDLF